MHLPSLRGEWEQGRKVPLVGSDTTKDLGQGMKEKEKKKDGEEGRCLT